MSDQELALLTPQEIADRREEILELVRGAVEQIQQAMDVDHLSPPHQIEQFLQTLERGSDGLRDQMVEISELVFPLADEEVQKIMGLTMDLVRGAAGCVGMLSQMDVPLPHVNQPRIIVPS